MYSIRPANADPATDWARQTWSELAARPDRARTVVVLPVHGLADHGMGLPLDAEETVGSAVLHAAVATAWLQPRVLVLPPLRLVAAPYAHARFGVDVETVLETLAAIVAGVHASGFSRVLFFNTSPWNAECVATAALDARTGLDLRTYVIDSRGIGLGFHPADTGRNRTQAVSARLLGRVPSHSQHGPVVRDTDFRPGFFERPAPVPFDPALDGEKLFVDSAAKLAGLLGEIVAHAAGIEHPKGTTLPPVCPPPQTVGGRSRELAGLMADEVARLPAKERALVIIPAGSIEQHGHHLPLGTDAMLGDLRLERMLPRLPADAPVYVAPAITYGKSNEHLGFAGTITLPARVLQRQLLALAADLKALGFRQIAVLNSHGGNSAVIVATLREIQTGLGLRAGMLGGYHRPDQSPQEAAYGFHAGEWETSLMLASAPGLVRMDRAVCEYPASIEAAGGLRLDGGDAAYAWKTSDVSKSGVIGDATLATAEKGARWLDESSAALAGKVLGLLANPGC